MDGTEQVFEGSTMQQVSGLISKEINPANLFVDYMPESFGAVGMILQSHPRYSMHEMITRADLTEYNREALRMLIIAIS